MAKIEGMVERRGADLWLTHALMIIGVLIIFFPIWLAFVASTVNQSDIVSPPMPVLPGDQFWENYSAALFSGVNVPVAKMLMNSLIMAVALEAFWGGVEQSNSLKEKLAKIEHQKSIQPQ